MTTPNSWVSVIIPAYNESHNIEKLLFSIKHQTYKNIETIVIDDSSTDNTANLARKYTKKVYTRNHAERSIQRNFGAKKAKGVYLLFLDADMELAKDLIKNCVKTIQKSKHKALIVPEHTAGDSLLSRLRRFERDMYMGDATIEVARFFEAKVFNEVGGYDPKLTGAEDYDLPKRVSEKYSIGWSNSYLVHHEENLTFPQLLKKKYYYAGASVSYADKHPDMVRRQGTIIFRKAYIRNWKKFVKKPVIGALFVLMRAAVTIAAIAGFIKVAGIRKFIMTVPKVLTN